MADLLGQSLRILGATVKNVGKEYASNAFDLYEDAKKVKDTLLTDGKNAKEVYANIRSGDITKKISNWFYSNINDDDDSSDGFDPGFKTDLDDGEVDTSTELSVDKMSEISDKQTNAMYKIGQKQAEQSVINTAEVISSFNNRSSEMITAINNINTSILGISEKMDKLISYNEIVAKKEFERSASNGLVDASGNLSLQSIYGAAKNSVKNNQFVSMGSSLVDILKTQGSPEDLLGFALNAALLDRNFKGLGDKSINQIGERFNEMIGAVSQSVMSELIKSGPFTKVFGDVSRAGEASTNFAEMVSTSYDTKRATFDGMTRYSIVNVIPEYLKKINESISGVVYNVDNNGKLIKGAQSNEFNKIVNTTFASSGLSSNMSKNILNDAKPLNDKISQEDINLAGKALTSAFVMYMYENGIVNLAKSELMYNDEAMNNAVSMLAGSSRKSRGYWNNVCSQVLLHVESSIVDGQSFVTNINKRVVGLKNQAVDFATSGRNNASQAGVFSMDILKSQFKQEMGSAFFGGGNVNTGSSTLNSTVNGATNVFNVAKDLVKGDFELNKLGEILSDHFTKDGKFNVKDTIKNTANVVDSFLAKKNMGDHNFSMMDYTRGIFGILNRGINVKNTNTSDDQTGYDNYSLQRKSVTQQSDSNKGLARQYMHALFSSKSTGEFVDYLMGDVADRSATALGGIFKSKKSSFGSSVKDELKQDTHSTHDYVRGLYNLVNRGINTRTVIVGESDNEFDQIDPGRMKSASFANDVVRKKSEQPPDEGLSTLIKTLLPTVGFSLGRNALAKFALNGVASRDINNAATGQNTPGTFQRIGSGLQNILPAAGGGVVGGLIGAYTAGHRTNLGEVGERIDDSQIVSDAKRVVYAVNGTPSLDERGRVVYTGGIVQNAQDFVGDRISGVATRVRDFGTAQYNSAVDAATIAGNADRTQAMINNYRGGAVYTQYATNVMNSARGVTSKNQDRQYGQRATALYEMREMMDQQQAFEDSGMQGPSQYGSYADMKAMYDEVADQSESIADANKNRKRRNIGDVVASVRNKTKDPNDTSTKILDVVSEGFKSVGSLLGKVTKAIANLGVSGIRNMSYGLKSMLEGLVGARATEDEDGNVIEEGHAGLLQILFIKPTKLLTKTMKTFTTFTFDVTKKLYKSMFGAITKVFSKATGWIKDHLGNVFSGVQKLVDNIKEKAAGDGPNIFQRAGNKFRSTQFGSGFLQGFDDARRAKEKASMRAETFADQKSDEISDMLKTGKDSVVGRIATILENIRDDVFGIKQNNSGDETEESHSDRETRQRTELEEAEEGRAQQTARDETNRRAGNSRLKNTTGDLLKSIGKSMGGMLQAMLGLGQTVISIVASLSGMQALWEMIQGILEDGLQPLNKVFQELMVLIKPVVEILTSVVTTIAEYVTSICGAIIDTIEPIIESLMPLFEMLEPLLGSILQVVEVIFKLVLAPLMIIFEEVLVPCIQMTTGILQVIVGVLQFGLGSMLSILGNIYGALAFVTDKLLPGDQSGLTDSAKALADSGNNMREQGVNSIKMGGEQIVTGLVNLVKPGNPETEVKEVETSREVLPTISDTESSGSSVMEGLMTTGSGNTYNRSISHVYNYKNMYGSGNTTQNSYGNYMNMDKRGCGPIALADAYSRRSGKKMDPRSLAANMSNNGEYETNRGTSVGGMINAGNRLGLGMRAGGVTPASLRRASNSNPITLVGSGDGFGTRRGNTHYVNVVGSDGRGGSYVSNPLTGKVTKRATSSLVADARLGIYGSGDEDELISLSDDTKSKLEALKSKTSNLLSLFNFENSEDTYVEEMENQTTAKRIEELINKVPGIEDEATALCKTENPKQEGETDSDYMNRISNIMAKDKYSYMVKASETEENQAILMRGMDAATWDQWMDEEEINKDLITSASTKIKTTSFKDTEGVSGGGGGSVFKANNAILALTNPSIFETNIKGSPSSESPIHEFFSKTIGRNAETQDGGWYAYRENPNAHGVGRDANSGFHEGVDINVTNDEDGTCELYPTCDGTVITTSTDGDGHSGIGNSVMWLDSDGNSHWYMHMHEKPLVTTGDSITGGMTLLGHIGNTGDSYGDHLHYQITRGNIANMVRDKTDATMINPLTYFSYSGNTSGTQGKIDLSTNSMLEQAGDNYFGSSYQNKMANTGYLKDALASGLSGAEIAAVTGMAIIEDSGEKIFGEKSITNTTHDYNGQAAVGLMNWLDGDIDYGDTLGEQLSYINNAYFNGEKSTHERGKVHANNFASYSKAYSDLMGKPMTLTAGQPYSPFIDTDLMEGMAHFVGSALVPAGWNTAEGLAKYLGPTARAYNWLIDNGYIKPTQTQSVSQKSDISFGSINSADDARALGELVYMDKGTDTRMDSQVSSVGFGAINSASDAAKYLGVNLSSKNGTTEASYDFPKFYSDNDYENARKILSNSYSDFDDYVLHMYDLVQSSTANEWKVAGENEGLSLQSAEDIFRKDIDNYYKKHNGKDTLRKGFDDYEIEARNRFTGIYNKSKNTKFADILTGNLGYSDEINSMFYPLVDMCTYGSGDEEDADIFNEIPPIDPNQFYNQYEAVNNKPANIVESSFISTQLQNSSSARLTKILNHTYEIKSNSMERLLTKIVDKLDNIDKKKPKSVLPKKETKKMFDEEIPSQVVRLSK